MFLSDVNLIYARLSSSNKFYNAQIGYKKQFSGLPTCFVIQQSLHLGWDNIGPGLAFW